VGALAVERSARKDSPILGDEEVISDAIPSARTVIGIDRTDTGGRVVRRRRRVVDRRAPEMAGLRLEA